MDADGRRGVNINNITGIISDGFGNTDTVTSVEDIQSSLWILSLVVGRKQAIQRLIRCGYSNLLPGYHIRMVDYEIVQAVRGTIFLTAV